MEIVDPAKDMDNRRPENPKGPELAHIVRKKCMDGHEITIECTIEMKPGLVPLRKW